MEYTVIVNGQSYDLPKKTLAVMENLDAVLKVDAQKNLTVKQRFEKLHKFMKDIVGEEATKEMFGSDKLEMIDLSELTLAVRKTIDAYDEPITDYDREKSGQRLDSLPIEKIIALGKSVDKLAAFPVQKT